MSGPTGFKSNFTGGSQTTLGGCAALAAAVARPTSSSVDETVDPLPELPSRECICVFSVPTVPGLDDVSTPNVPAALETFLLRHQ
jgi:hypothetical protein